jgi:cytoskeletal protein RodZ
MFQTEFKLTIGITPELNSILSGFLGYLSANNAVTEKQAENTESPEKEKEKEPTGRQTRKSKTEKTPAAMKNAEPSETQDGGKDDSTESSDEKSTPESPSESDSPAITVEMLRARVREVVTADRSKRGVIEAKFAEFNAYNPTTLDVKHYQEYWDFLNNL